MSEREQVTLRRTITTASDEYHLDGKHVTRETVLSMLETSGFSRSNPYYIVQQNKIIDLSTAEDSQRLDLLKEVAGTTVYENRRRESLKILEETEEKRRQIEQVMEYIEDRLNELETDKKELAEYQKLDRERKAIEYAIYDLELKQIREQYEEIMSKRNQLVEVLQAQEDQEDDPETEENVRNELAQIQVREPKKKKKKKKKRRKEEEEKKKGRRREEEEKKKKQ